MSSIKFPCGVCLKPVANNHNALCCDSCDKWIHIKCNLLNKYTYKKLQKDNSPWFCINCTKDQLPFHSQSNSNFLNGHFTTLQNITFEDLLKNLDLEEDCPSSEYYTPNEFSQVKLNKSNLFIHLNISSLSYHIDELNLFLSQIKHKPKIIAISESKIRKNKEPLSNINITGYEYEYTSTEAEKGGTLIYISKDLKYKIRKDLTITKAKELESTFVEIINKNEKKIQ